MNDYKSVVRSCHYDFGGLCHSEEGEFYFIYISRVYCIVLIVYVHHDVVGFPGHYNREL